ncbi:hypothetical protein BDZ85DRAFT_257874 [Elsinoe ampelina]|uniref:Uncharacterized protein n=1 Tax=Elsinoe ampelina TaxID=302913 RepID=A0A6A6GIU6_9PEZI|nr:hypothetical protein BDZ85DRAFT_257874 [Elsinoe ampelina]
MPLVSFHEWKAAVLGGPITGLIGSIIFLFVAILSYLEVLNAPSDPCCAYTVTNTTTSTGAMVVTVAPDLSQCHHHHQNHSSLLASDRATSLIPPSDPTPLIAIADKSLTTVDVVPVATPSAPVTAAVPSKPITLLPRRHHFLPHHLQQLAFLAALINLFGNLIYFPSTIVSLPPVQARISPIHFRYANWFLQIISSLGMWLASLLLVSETQIRWWRPAFGVVGWWISMLNVTGGFGFLISGILGYAAYTDICGPLYLRSMVANFIGCWGFFIAAILMWYEATEKFPVVDVR